MAKRNAHITPGFSSELLYVKWNSPVEELVSVARLANALVERRIAEAGDVCIAVPNRNWGVQLENACDEHGIEFLDCMPVRPTRAARLVLARLDAAARADGALEAWAALGGGVGQARAFAESCEGIRGHGLARAAGAHEVPELRNALRHVVGGEDAAALARLVRAQMAHPSAPEGMQVISIAHYLHVDARYEYLFCTGCVDGLIPGARAFEAGSEPERSAALEEARNAYRAIVDAPRTRTVLSGFVKADVRLAQAAHIRYARTKRERGVELAMTAPSRFLAEEGPRRPSTEGGQAMLKRYRLV